MLESIPAQAEKSAPVAHTKREARTEAILRAALEELAEVGYNAFSFEAVADRVGVAKTTVYRRYPTKLALIRAAVQQIIGGALGAPPNTGSLRGDLIAMGQQAVQIASSVLGQSLIRVRMLDRVAPELDQMGVDFEAEREALHRSVATRAIERGELAHESDFFTLLDVLSGSLMFRLTMKRLPVGELEIARVVDILLNGVAKPHEPHGRRSLPNRTSR